MRWTKKISKNYKYEKDLYNRRKDVAKILKGKKKAKEEKNGQTD